MVSLHRPGRPGRGHRRHHRPGQVTVWLGAAGATDLTRRDAEELAAVLLLRVVRQLGG